MPEANAGRPQDRTLTVVFYSAAVYIVLGLVLYTAYLMLAGLVGGRSLEQELLILQVAFYTFFATHLLASAVTVRALIRQAGVPVYPVSILAIGMFAISLYPVLGILSFLNTCQTSHSLPLPGSSC